jgi:Tol biopolymer transport system component
MAILHPVTDRRLVAYPVGPGEARTISAPGLAVRRALPHPDGKRIVIEGNEPGRGPRFYLQEVAGGKARPFTPEGYRTLGFKPLSPDGRFVLVVGPDRKVYRYPVEGGEPTLAPGLTVEDGVQGWTPDGRFAYISQRGERPLKIFRHDLATGARELVRELMPSDASGVESVGPALPLPDGKSWVFGYSRILSALHVVDGLK